MKLLHGTDRAMFEKDALSIWNDRPIRSMLLAMPVVFVIGVPIVFLAMIYMVPTESPSGTWRLVELLPDYVREWDIRQIMFYLLVNIVCPMFFLLNALLTASLTSAILFGGEKGQATAETLMLTPLSARRIFYAKVRCSLLFAGISSVVSLIALVIVVAVGSILLGLFFFGPLWIVVLLLLTPAVSLLGTLSMAILSRRAKDTVSCAQLSGYAALPVILLFVLQLTGLYQLDFPVLLVFGALALAADGFLWMICLRCFSPERLSL